MNHLTNLIKRLKPQNILTNLSSSKLNPKIFPILSLNIPPNQLLPKSFSFPSQPSKLKILKYSFSRSKIDNTRVSFSSPANQQLYQRGKTAYYKQNNAELAMQLFQQLLLLQPQNPVLLLDISRFYIMQNNPQKQNQLVKRIPPILNSQHPKDVLSIDFITRNLWYFQYINQIEEANELDPEKKKKYIKGWGEQPLFPLVAMAEDQKLTELKIKSFKGDAFYHMEKNEPVAEKYYKVVLERIDEVQEKNRHHLLDTLKNLESIYKNEGEWEKVRKCQEKRKEIQRLGFRG